MHPELFEIPILHLTLKSYGLMMVIGFLAALFVMRRLSKDLSPDPQFITNAALYSLIAGVVGARIFYVLHHLSEFRGRFVSVFAVWQGGLELLGGVVLALAVIVLYLRYKKLPVRRCLDILAVGLMLALAFGRIGCFLNGCCFGKPANLPWAVRFPYGSFAYRSQVKPDHKRNRKKPHRELPEDFFDVFYEQAGPVKMLKPYEQLTGQQKEWLRESDKVRSLPVHPTELYSSANAFFICLILFLFWRRTQNALKFKKSGKLFAKPGYIFTLMFMLYSIGRFLIECVRDDNPFEYGWWIIYKGGTVSQNLGIYMVIISIAMMITFQKLKPDRYALNRAK